MIRAITQFHENRKLVARAETAVGRCIVFLLASAMLLWHGEYSPVFAGGALLVIVILALPLVMAFPERRRLVLSCASVLAALEFFWQRDLTNLHVLAPDTWVPQHVDLLRYGALVATLLSGLYLVVLILRRYSLLPSVVRRYPVVTLHMALWAGILIESIFRAPSVIHVVLPLVAWRLSYLVQFASRGGMADARFADHLFYLWPAYGPNGVPTPLGKGAAYLSRHEARDPTHLAISQLAGLKLLALALAWETVRQVLDAVAHGDKIGALAHWLGGATLGLPRLHYMMDHNLTDAPLAVANLYLELISWALYIAVYGHIIVGCLRLLGFNVFRHVYKPLLATSIVDFWSRWSYYYKELLTDFFYYPTFLRSAWVGAKVRLFLAVFAAAAVGNMYFTILTEVELLFTGDVATMLTRWGSRSVYCILLATGIWLSMLRQQGLRGRAQPPLGRWPAVRSAFFVCTFYAVVHVWNVGQSHLGPVDRLLWLSKIAW